MERLPEHGLKVQLWRKRREERGAAVFIVVMVVTLLTAMGIFAARSASLVDAASGFNREALQTHYITEYGAVSVLTELGTGTAPAYSREMATGSDECPLLKNYTPPGGGKTPCRKFFAQEIGGRVASYYAGRTLLEPAINPAPPSLPTPGSLGFTEVAGDFRVQMTDPGPVEKPVAGTDVGGTSTSFHYKQVSLTATGLLRPGLASDTCTTGSASTTGVESMRAQVIIGPLER
ncbi:MAG TPA: hypothetical protein VGJ84_08260 [Polyangiaceae bacterium]